MRAVFLLLLFANVAFYAWARYGAPAETAHPAPASRQIEPEKLELVAPKDLSAPKKPAPVAAGCIEWGSFTVADAPHAEQALEPLALGGRLTQRRAEDVAAWWVLIPSMGSRQGALKKGAELRNLGVDDFFIVQDEGEHRWALSLGVFRSEDAAQAHLAALQARGVRSARVVARETLVPKIWLQVKGVDAPLEARLKEIARQIEGTELKSCS
jgi:hypothetical protein